MITKEETEIILQSAKKYNVSLIILFGSYIKKGKEASDIYLGVKGIKPQLFFKFYAELYKYLSKPVHLIDLFKKSLFNDLVEETGVKIYG